MTEDEKRKFSGWESLRDHAWREFEDKSRAEWRLSFGIWAALLASASALIASGKSTIVNLMQQLSPWVITLFALVIVLVHAFFLYWIQTKLQNARTFLSEAHDEMRKLLDAPDYAHEVRSIWGQRSMYVELAITTLLIGVVLVVLKCSGG